MRKISLRAPIGFVKAGANLSRSKALVGRRIARRRTQRANVTCGQISDHSLLYRHTLLRLLVLKLRCGSWVNKLQCKSITGRLVMLNEQFAARNIMAGNDLTFVYFFNGFSRVHHIKVSVGRLLTKARCNIGLFRSLLRRVLVNSVRYLKFRARIFVSHRARLGSAAFRYVNDKLSFVKSKTNLDHEMFFADNWAPAAVQRWFPDVMLPYERDFDKTLFYRRAWDVTGINVRWPRMGIDLADLGRLLRIGTYAERYFDFRHLSEMWFKKFTTVLDRSRFAVDYRSGDRLRADYCLKPRLFAVENGTFSRDTFFCHTVFPPKDALPGLPEEACIFGYGWPLVVTSGIWELDSMVNDWPFCKPVDFSSYYQPIGTRVYNDEECEFHTK